MGLLNNKTGTNLFTIIKQKHLFIRNQPIQAITLINKREQISFQRTEHRKW